MGVHTKTTASQWNGPPIHHLKLCAQECVQQTVAQKSCGVTMEWMQMAVGWEIGACTTLTAPNLVPNQPHNVLNLSPWNAVRTKWPAGEERMKITAHIRLLHALNV